MSTTSKTYRVELHTLTQTRAEFREKGTLTTNITIDTPTHTWAMTRTEWEELGRPLSFNLRVEMMAW